MSGVVQTEEIERLIGQLEGAASRLRAGGLSDDEAAQLIEECAGLAARAGTELERRSRGEEVGAAALGAIGQNPLTGPQQDRLL